MSKYEEIMSGLAEHICSDDNTICVKTVAKIFSETVEKIEDGLEEIKTIKSKLGEKVWTNFVTCLYFSFLNSIYISASKDPIQLAQRMQESIMATQSQMELDSKSNNKSEA